MHLLLNFSHVQSFFTMLKCLTIILVLMLNQSTTTGSIYGPRPRIRNYSKDELVIMRKEFERFEWLLKEVEHSNSANKEENSKDHVAIAGELEPAHKDFMELSTSANGQQGGEQQGSCGHRWRAKGDQHKPYNLLHHPLTRNSCISPFFLPLPVLQEEEEALQLQQQWRQQQQQSIGNTTRYYVRKIFFNSNKVI
jgi:hypothetical protein